MGRQFVGNALASHAAGKKLCRFVFVHLALRGRGGCLLLLVIRNRHVETAPICCKRQMSPTEMR